MNVKRVKKILNDISDDVEVIVEGYPSSITGIYLVTTKDKKRAVLIKGHENSSPWNDIISYEGIDN